MENKKLGQDPAFATGSKNKFDQNGDSNGISKRLYIATKITAGILSNSELRIAMLMDSKNSKVSPSEYLVGESYNIADELLKQEDK